MNYLIVVAHPDDEALGAGATMAKFASLGHQVDVCILSSDAQARYLHPGDTQLKDDTDVSMRLLGVKNVYHEYFPNIKLNNVDHLLLVQAIEKAIVASKPDVVITHHPSDTNNDHLHTSLACQAAIRLFQRKPELKPIEELWFMEVPSATEWSTNSSLNRFTPNTYVEVGAEFIDVKIKALSSYRDVMRPYPHPRSAEAIKGFALMRGAESGCNYAEAFECVLRRIVK